MFVAILAVSCQYVDGKKYREGKEVLLVDLRGKSIEEKFAVLALQGLANRTGPRVFVQLGKENSWQDWHFESGIKNNTGLIWSPAAAKDFGSRYGNIQDAWIEILGRQGYEFRSVSIAELLKTLRGDWKGWVLYQSFGTDLAPAATWAGIEAGVPVTSNLLQQWSQAGVEAPVIADYAAIRSQFSTGSNARLEGHRWMIGQLLPQCRKDGAVSRDRTYNLDSHDTVVDVDQATQNRWVVYDLNHDAVTNHAEAPKNLKVNPPDAPLLDELLSKLEPFSFVYGWGRSSEESFVRSLNRNGVIAEVSGVPNNSFFAKLPDSEKPFRQKRNLKPAEVNLENKIYVTFMVNEGDTLKIANTFHGFGAWLQPERGQVPINWGIEPNLLKSHPFLMRYYYDTMSTNDYFFAPPSGWGYAHPGYLPPELLMPYAKKINEGMKLADLRFLNIWWLGELRSRKQWDPFIKATGAEGHVDWIGRQQVEYPQGEGIINVCANHFYTYKMPAEQFAARLLEDMENAAPPWFVVIYGASEHGTPYRFSELAKRLPGDRFKIVLLDEFFGAAIKARPQVEGRIWKPGPNAPKGVAP